MFRGVVEGFFQALFWFATLLFLVIAPALRFGPDLETRYYPVMDSVSVEQVSYELLPPLIKLKHDGDYYWYRVSFDKVRDCRPLKETFEWYLINYDGTKSRINAFETSTGSLPLGENSVYVYTEKRTDYFKSQRFVVTHDCHSLWPTRTNLNIGISSNNLK